MSRYSLNGPLTQAVKCLSILVLAFLIVGCGGGGDSKSGSSNSESGGSVSNSSDDNTTSDDNTPGGVRVSENLRIFNVDSPKDFQTDPNSGLLISERVQFPLVLPENTVSFQLVSRGGDAISSLFNSLENPNGVELLLTEALRIRNIREDYSSILVPQGPQFTATSGPSSYSMQAIEIPSDLNLTLALRTGPIPSNGASLKVKPFASINKKYIDFSRNSLADQFRCRGISKASADHVEGWIGQHFWFLHIECYPSLLICVFQPEQCRLDIGRLVRGAGQEGFYLE